VSTSGLPHRRNRQLAGPPVYEPARHPASDAVLKETPLEREGTPMV